MQIAPIFLEFFESPARIQQFNYKFRSEQSEHLDY